MSGPDDTLPKDLIASPKDYPDARGQAGAIFARDVAQARRRPTPRRRTAPRSGPTKPEEVTTKDLDVKINFTPPFIGGKAAFPEPPLQVSADVTWSDAAGVRRPWEPERIHIRYGSKPEFDAGPGPYHIEPVFGDRTWFVRVSVDLWIDGRWQRKKVAESAPVLAFCSVDMTTGLDQEDKDFIATLYGEGGGMASVSDAEATRIAWCMKSRVDLVRRVVDDAGREPSNQLFIDRLDAIRRDFSADATPTYHSVLSHPGQFKAWERKGFRQALKPMAIVEPHACATLARTRRIALEVRSGLAPHFDAAGGDAFFRGCLFYMTKKQLRDWKASHPGNTRWDYDTLPPLPAIDDHRADHHWYWPLRGKYPWLA